MGLVERTVGGAYNQYAWIEERPMFKAVPHGDPTLEDTGERYVNRSGREAVGFVTCTASRGETIRITAEEAARGDALGAFVEALPADGGVSLGDMSDDDLIAWVVEQTAKDILDAVGDDPNLAQRAYDAEWLRGDDARSSLLTRLVKAGAVPAGDN